MGLWQVEESDRKIAPALPKIVPLVPLGGVVAGSGEKIWPLPPRPVRRSFAPGPNKAKTGTGAGAASDPAGGPPADVASGLAGGPVADAALEDIKEGGSDDEGAKELDETVDESWGELTDLGIATLAPLLDPPPVPDDDEGAAAAAAADEAVLVAGPPWSASAPMAASTPREPSGALAEVVTAFVPGGRISFYASKNAFEAVCSNRSHGKCVMTRTATGSASSTGPPTVGRPCGFLTAWLANGEHTTTKANHWGIDCQLSPHAVRMAGRDRLKSAPHGPELLAKERPALGGEPEEAEDDWVYMKLR